MSEEGNSDKTEKRYMEYLAHLDEAGQQELTAISEELLSQGAFDSELSFGTGGVRSLVGHGTALLNVSNIARLTHALAAALEKAREQAKNPLVVIAYDSRNSSVEFSRTARAVLRKAGFRVKIFEEPAPTPLLSYAVRRLGAAAGIVITASHNPPAYNGFKVYWSDGGQITSPYDKIIEENYREMKYADLAPETLTYDQIAPEPDELLGDEMTLDFTNYLTSENICSPGEKEISILYSPLHGTGGPFFQKVFSAFGFQNFHVLPEQAKPDGNFPTLALPNPEEPSSFELLLKAARPKKTKLLLASDPDADRVGAAIYNPQSGDYTFLNGNQIGSLMLDHLISHKSGSLDSPYVCKTIVTTLMQNRIAADHGIRLVETLTGFKYIAAEIARDPENYLFGGEESYGYLPVTGVRDKDSISSALVLAGMAEKTNLLERLDQLYLQHGLYHDRLVSIALERTNDSPDIVTQLLARISDPAIIGQTVGGRKIVDLINLQPGSPSPVTSEGRELKERLENARVIQLWFSPDARLTLRPSGTEPKIKIYVSLRYDREISPGNLENAKLEIAKQSANILDDFGKMIDIDIK